VSVKISGVSGDNGSGMAVAVTPVTVAPDVGKPDNGKRVLDEYGHGCTE